MKILQIHTNLSVKGGIETVIFELANQLSMNQDVRVCSIFKPSEESFFYTRLSENVKKDHLGIEKNGFSLRNLWRVFRYLKNTDAEVVHFHGFFYYYVLPIVLFHKRMKFVYTFHNDAFMENTKWDSRIIWLKKLCIKFHWIFPVTISPESKASFAKLYKQDSRLIRNGITSPKILNTPNDIDLLRITNNTKVFFHPGRITEQKNQLVLCKVFQRLINDGHDIVLLIAGTKQDSQIYNEMKSMFSERIKYLGERNDVPELLSRADGFCLPSKWEGLPMTLLESLSVGCVPICSPAGGVIDVIKNGYNGFLSKSFYEEDYYQCMKKFLALSKEQITSIKKNCLESFAPYDVLNMVKKYLEYYKELTRRL